MSALTLYQIEDELLAWANSWDLAETDDERLEIAARVHGYLQVAREKRDRFVEFLRHVDSQIELAKLEEERLASRRRSLERMRDSLEGYAIQTLESLGVKKLEGNTSTLSLHRRPASVVITNAAQIPLDYQRATVTVPADQVADLCCQFTTFGDVKYDIRKTEIKEAIQAGEEVPGADLAMGGHSLRIK